MKTVKIALVGYGNVGRAFVQMLEKRRDFLAERYHSKAEIVAVCTRSRGALVEPSGLDAAEIDSRPFTKEQTAFDVIDQVDYDVMMELTPINIRTGQPAIDHIKHALQRGKHVITANKGPIARAYRELKAMAREHHVKFYHESTVMDGVPVFNLTDETLKGCKILEVSGILNATTNYVLSEMEHGISWEDAVAEGQRLGFVEADPSVDLDGWDAAAKLTALMNVLMDVEITPEEIQREGIRGITPEQMVEARRQNQRFKLLCRGWVENGRPVGTVAPQMVDADSLYASINGTAAMVTITTDLMGSISVVEHVFQPEVDQTAYGVLGDLFRILEHTDSDVG